MKHRKEEDDLYRKFAKQREEQDKRIKEEIRVITFYYIFLIECLIIIIIQIYVFYILNLLNSYNIGIIEKKKLKSSKKYL